MYEFIRCSRCSHPLKFHEFDYQIVDGRYQDHEVYTNRRMNNTSYPNSYDFIPFLVTILGSYLSAPAPRLRVW